MIYNVVLVSGVQQSDSVIHIHYLFLFRCKEDSETSSLVPEGTEKSPSGLMVLTGQHHQGIQVTGAALTTRRVNPVRLGLS